MSKLTFTTADIAALIHQPPATVHDFVRDGDLPARPSIKGTLTIFRQDLLSFLRRHNYNTIALESRTTLLVINDDKEIQQTLDQALKTCSTSCDCITIENGFEAITKLDQVRPDMIILNGDSDGFDTKTLLGTMRKSGGQVRVLIITTQASDTHNYSDGGDLLMSPPNRDILQQNLTNFFEVCPAGGNG